MSTKKSTKKTAKKTTKKTVKKKVVKKQASKKNVKKKVAKAAAGVLPNPKVFTEMIAAVALLMNRVEILAEQCAKLISNSPLVKNPIETPEETDISGQIDLFPTEDSGSAKGSDFTQEDVTQALQKVSTVHGMGKVKEVLKKFKAERISDIYAKPNDYKKFISHCENVVATKA